MRPTLPLSRNTRPVDLSDAIATGFGELVMTVYRVIAMVPIVVILLMRPPMNSVNHMLPSGPAEMRNGSLPAVAGKSVQTPAGDIRPMLLLLESVYQMLPSGPAARKVT